MCASGTWVILGIDAARLLNWQNEGNPEGEFCLAMVCGWNGDLRAVRK
jgi:hypothetical protein